MQLLYAAAAGLALALPAAALAHDNHPAGAPAQAAKKEQKPWGIAGDARDVQRSIEVVMTDAMRFSPSSIQVRQGETVRFVLRNRGKLLHEMVIGDSKTLDEHAALMARFPDMEHDEPHMAHVAAGKQAVLVWKFNRAGDFGFACLIAGHYQAGMTGTVRVLAAAGRTDPQQQGNAR